MKSCNVFLGSCKRNENKALSDIYLAKQGRAAHLCQVARARGKKDLTEKLIMASDKYKALSLHFADRYKRGR